MADSSAAIPPSVIASKRLRQLKKAFILLLVLLALIINSLAPILAWQWVQRPFLGFLTEHTLVVANIYNGDWLARQQVAPGIHRLRAVNNQPVSNSQELSRVLRALSPGEQVELVLQKLPTPAFETITAEVTIFPWSDFWVMFGLSYLIGLIYLALGLFVYQVRASERGGPIFLSFCALFSIFSAAFFDLYTSHRLTPVWTAVLPFLGATLVHLAFIFPRRSRLLRRRPRARFLPYIPAVLLSAYGLWGLYQPDPTGYFFPWRLEFAFIGLSILVFLTLLVRTWYLNFSLLLRQQTVIILWGSAVAFIPALLWSFSTAWLGVPVTFDRPIYLILFGPTIFFPLAIAYTLLRHQLLALDSLVKKMAVYISMIIVIMTVYLLGMTLLNGLFKLSLSLASPVTLSIYSLIVIVFLEPLRNGFQTLIDRLSSNLARNQQDILQNYAGRLAALPLDIDGILDLYVEQVQGGIRPIRLFVFFIDSRETSYNIRTWLGQEANSSVQISYMVSDELPYWLNTRRMPLRLTVEGNLLTASSIKQEEIARLVMFNIRVVVPLFGTKKLLGWLALGDKEALKPYNRNDLAFLTNLSNQTAIALENAQLFEKANRKTQELMALQETTLDISSEQETERILTSVLERAATLLNAMGGSIYLLDPAYGLLNNEICFNLDADYASISLKVGQGIAGQAAKTGQPQMINKYSSLPEQVEVYSNDTFGSVVAVPLAWKGEIKGVLELIRDLSMPPFDREEVELLNILAHQAAITLENARLIKEAHDKASQLTILNQVNRFISATLDREAALKRILEVAVDILDTEAGSIFLIDETRQSLIFEIALGPTGVQLVGAKLPLDTASIAGSIAIQRQAMVVNAVADDPHWDTSFDRANDFQTRDILGVPMEAFNEVVGVIEVVNKRDGHGFTEEDKTALAIFAGQAAIAIVNAQRFTQTDQALASRVQELNTLHIIDRELNATLNFEAVLALTLSRTMDSLGASVGLIGVMNDDQTGLYFRLMIGVAREYKTYRHDPWPLEQGLIGRAAATGEPVLAVEGEIDNFASDGRSTAQLCVPIVLKGNVMGVISLELADVEPFSAKDAEFATRLAGHAALAIQNARLFEEVNLANQAKTEFMSVASHELKIPMTSIKGYARLLEMLGGQDFTDQQKDFLRIIISNIDRMDRIVSDLLDVSRIETGRIKLELGEVSIKAVIDDVIRLVNTQIQAKDLTLEVDVPPTIPPIWADYGRMVQVMTNLISNAYKYTPEGGHIAVKARQANGQPAGPCLSVCVTDTGFGISEADQKELFTKFFRASDPNIREKPGTGLGLAITKSLVEIHGGTMWFESILGQGSTFGFDLPLNPVSA
jgi:signal transduction histidine kinase